MGWIQFNFVHMKLKPHFNPRMSGTGPSKVGVISMRGFIGEEVKAGDFKDVLDYFVANGASAVEINLENCLGGSVFEGATISAHIRGCSIPVNGKASGACASMATIIFGSCKDRLIDTMSYLVTHRPSGEDAGCFESHENSAKNLKKLYDEMGKVYASLTGMTEEEAKAKFMPYAKDVFLSATEAVQLKLATGTFNSGVKAALPLDVLMKSDLKAVAAFYDKQIKKISNENSEMDYSKIAMAIGMTGETDENKILAAVAKMKQDNADLQAKVQLMETEAKTKAEASAKAYVKAALDAGKITAAEQAPFEKMAIADLDSVKAILDQRKPHTTAGEQIRNEKTTDHKYGRKDGESDGQFYMRLWKNEPKTLERLQKEDPAQFKQIKEAAAKEAQ